MYRIEGLEPEMFERLFEMDDAELARIAARRVIADGPGFPCRVSLVDAAAGETVVLCHHAHHDVASPYRAAGPIYVRRGVAAPSSRRSSSAGSPIRSSRTCTRTTRGRDASRRASIDRDRDRHGMRLTCW